MKPRGVLGRLGRALPVFAVLLLSVGASRPAQAVECFTELMHCYNAAARVEGYFDMWMHGLDCELTFVDCTRMAVLGR